MASDNSGKQTHVMIDNFIIDASLSERHTFDSDVTEYPVESGSNVVDNIRPLPLTVEMECLVTNTPIGIVANVRKTFGFFSFIDTKPVDTAYALLTGIRDKREPVTIQTSLRTYENMALERLSIPRGPGGADALTFTAQFKQIQYVTNKRTARVATPLGQGGGKKKDTVTAAPNPDDNRYILIDIKTNEWWDPDTESWTFYAVYNKDIGARITRSDVGGSNDITVTPVDASTWSLFRKGIETVTINKSFVPGSIGQEQAAPDYNFNRHPTSNQRIIPITRCKYDFIIRNNTGNKLPTSLKHRTL